MGKETNTYKRKIRNSLEIESLGQLNVEQQSIEVSTIGNKAFLNGVGWNQEK